MKVVSKPNKSEKEPNELGVKALELCRQAGTAEHQFDHRVYNPFCEHCVAAEATRKQGIKERWPWGRNLKGLENQRRVITS